MKNKAVCSLNLLAFFEEVPPPPPCFFLLSLGAKSVCSVVFFVENLIGPWYFLDFFCLIVFLEAFRLGV